MLRKQVFLIGNCLLYNVGMVGDDAEEAELILLVPMTMTPTVRSLMQ